MANQEPTDAALDIRTLVRAGYNKIDYEGAFRLGTDLTAFEESFFGSMCDCLAPDARILDLGCGPGIPYDLHLSDRGYSLTGIDFCLKHLRKAAARVPTGSFICADLMEVRFPTESFDAVLSLYTIFHMPKSYHREMLERIYGMLKSGGVSLLTLGAREADGEDDWLGGRMVWSSFGPKVYAEMLKKCNFQILRSEFEGSPEDEEYHWWVLVQKN